MDQLPQNDFNNIPDYDFKSRTPMKIYFGSLNPNLTILEIESYLKSLNLCVYFIQTKHSRKKKYMIGTTLDTKTHIFLTKIKKIHTIKEFSFTTDIFVTGEKKEEKDAEEVKKKIYIGNLPEGLTDEDLKRIFERFGGIKTAYIRSRPLKSGGNVIDLQYFYYGFIVFLKEISAINAVKIGYINFKNRKISVKQFKAKWKNNSSLKIKVYNREEMLNSRVCSRPLNVKNSIEAHKNEELSEEDYIFFQGFRRESITHNDQRLLKYVDLHHKIENLNLSLNLY